MSNFITEFKILERSEYDEGAIYVRTYGRFKFDGRLRKDQVATFTAFTGRDDYQDNVVFKVVVNKKSGLVRREMKACAQKDAINAELLGYVHRENLRAAIREDEKENESENVSENEVMVVKESFNAVAEYGVDVERELAGDDAVAVVPDRERFPITAELNDMVAAAAVKDSSDKLEIPSFLKRS